MLFPPCGHVGAGFQGQGSTNDRDGQPSTTSEVSAGLKTPWPKPGAAEFQSKSTRLSRFYSVFCPARLIFLIGYWTCLLWGVLMHLDAIFLAGLYLKTPYYTS